MTRVPLFTRRHVEQAVSPADALEAVRAAFLAYAGGAWTMPPKVYVTNYPSGDFRAMPALGGGHALLKWVTSFPGNPARSLPTVTGVVLLSNAETGELEAVLDAASVTALRTGAAAVLACETLGRADAQTAAVIGAGVNGTAAAATFVARGRDVCLWDVDTERARGAAAALGTSVARSLEEGLAADLLVTVTPGHNVLLTEGALQPGQHVSLMGADGPGKAEIAPTELARVHAFREDEREQASGDPRPARGLIVVDDWEQASHGGEVAQLAGVGELVEDAVVTLGAILAGAVQGRRSPRDITLFDSTGLAIQDLAIAIAAYERRDELDLTAIELE